MIFKGIWSRLKVMSGLDVGQMLSGIHVETMLILSDWHHKPESYHIVAGLNMGRILSGYNIERMLIWSKFRYVSGPKNSELPKDDRVLNIHNYPIYCVISLFCPTYLWDHHTNTAVSTSSKGIHFAVRAFVYFVLQTTADILLSIEPVLLHNKP